MIWQRIAHGFQLVVPPQGAAAAATRAPGARSASFTSADGSVQVNRLSIGNHFVTVRLACVAGGAHVAS